MDREIAKITAKLNEEKNRRKKAIGERIRVERKKHKLSLKQLSERLTDYGQSISLSQLSRIEIGEVAVDDDLRIVLSEALNIPEGELRGASKKEPLFITKRAVAEKHLQMVIEGTSVNDGSASPHKNLIDNKVYRYVPLTPEIGDLDDRPEEPMDESKMQKFLVQIEHADSDFMRKEGLAKHSGEEIMYVIKGQLYLWYKQPDSLDVHKKLLEEGDYLHFSSEIYHGFSAPKDQVAQALFIFSDVKIKPTPQLVVEQPKQAANSLK